MNSLQNDWIAIGGEVAVSEVNAVRHCLNLDDDYNGYDYNNDDDFEDKYNDDDNHHCHDDNNYSKKWKK